MSVTNLGPMGLPFPGGTFGAKSEQAALKKQDCVGGKRYLVRSSAFKRISAYILTILGV